MTATVVDLSGNRLSPPLFLDTGGFDGRQAHTRRHIDRLKKKVAELEARRDQFPGGRSEARAIGEEAGRLAPGDRALLEEVRGQEQRPGPPGGQHPDPARHGVGSRPDLLANPSNRSSRKAGDVEPRDGGCTGATTRRSGERCGDACATNAT